VIKTAHLISSGFKLSSDELTKTKSYWSNLGLEFVHEPHLLNETSGDLLCSENLQMRFDELKKAFASNESKIVWSLRGGYGAHQLLPLLKGVSFDKQKLYMGFSDGSSIHYYMNMHLKWPSLHSPHPNTFHQGLHSSKVFESVKAALFNESSLPYEFTGLSLLNKTSEKTLEAEIVGGNLTTLVSLLGTPFDKGALGKILFLEEVEEPAYKVMRHLHHMSQAGFFKGIKALVFGHISHSNHNQEELIFKTVSEWSKDQKFPVIWGLNVGHKHEHNHPLWLLKKSRLELDEKPSLLNNI